MDKENNSDVVAASRNKGVKETFIFGSWKCRNTRKTRVTSVEVTSNVSDEREKSLKDAGSSNEKSWLAGAEQQPEDKSEVRVTRRAISVYDQLHEQDFWCPRCSCKMEEPRLLPCLHSVCNNCVNEFMSKSYRGLARLHAEQQRRSSDGLQNRLNQQQHQQQQQSEGCPICDFPLPGHGSSIPPPHYSLQHRLVIYAVRRRLSQRAICCDVCPDEVQATQHCPTCLCNLCQDCGADHEAQQQQHSSSRSHRVRPLWEAKRIRRVAVCLTHPAHPLRYHCLACQQVTCKECMWQGAHRGHASEDAASAGSRAGVQLTRALRRARAMLNSLLTEYNDRVFEEADRSVARSRTAFDHNRDSLPRTSHLRSRSTISSHSREAKERIQEFSRLRRARYLIDAIFIGEDLLANGSDVEILSLKRLILKRLKFLGVPIDSQVRLNNTLNKSKSLTHHSGVYHCCTFCSSGGKKETTCACGGTMPGGYKGCGHGHPGHPGTNHWSCCGSIYRDNKCLLPQKRTIKITL